VRKIVVRMAHPISFFFPATKAALAEIIQHMNADRKDALVMLARTFAHTDSTEATMTAADRLGFHVRLIYRKIKNRFRITYNLAAVVFIDCYSVSLEDRTMQSVSGVSPVSVGMEMHQRRG
jgi:uncharacterized protein DUF2470